MSDLTVDYQSQMISGKTLGCDVQHPGLSCLQFAFVKFLLTGKRFSIFFIPMHFLPMLLFRTKDLKNRPIRTLFRTTKNTVHSLLFLCSMVGLIRIILCTLKRLKRPQGLGGLDGLMIGFFSGTSILFESEGRSYEMTLQLIPRFLETVFNHFNKKFPALKMKQFELLLFSLIIGLIHYCYQHNREAIKSTYLPMFTQFWGKN